MSGEELSVDGDVVTEVGGKEELDFRGVLEEDLARWSEMRVQLHERQQYVRARIESVVHIIEEYDKKFKKEESSD